MFAFGDFSEAEINEVENLKEKREIERREQLALKKLEEKQREEQLKQQQQLLQQKRKGDKKCLLNFLGPLAQCKIK